jgi:hypothetical protein
MNRSKFIFPIVFSLLLCLFLFTASFAQTPGVKAQGDPSYDIFLQVVVGSNEPGERAELPANLSNISRQLKSNFAFSNYRLATTFIGRVGNEGNFEYKSVSNIFGEETDGEFQTFFEYSLSNFRQMPEPKSGADFQIGGFRFGAKIPVRMGSAGKDENGKALAPPVAYEPIGITATRLAVPENTPTLMGTLILPKTRGTVFLVLTVKPSGQSAR